MPSKYNKGLQESFEPMLEGTKTVTDSIEIATGVLSTMTIFLIKKMAGGAQPGYIGHQPGRLFNEEGRSLQRHASHQRTSGGFGREGGEADGSVEPADITNCGLEIRW